MIVSKVNTKRATERTRVLDSFVDKGLIEGGHASLPDIDVDYASDRRQEMKEYLEERYNVGGRQRVFSAGTFTTLKLKAALKDVARVHRVPHGTVNYITSMLDDGADWTGLFKIAATNRKVRDFIQTYPNVIEDVRMVLGQPKAASVHASAIIVTPEKRNGEVADCFDFLPIRKMDGALVSEFDGYSVDEIGLLKEDVLATKELAKLSATINLVNEHYNQNLTIEKITSEMLDDEKTYRILSDGNTQNVFQFSSPGITRFIQDVQPNCIEDLIAINALFRPATLDIGATDDYVRYRRGDVAPVYNFGCYEATKNTYGLMCIASGSEVLTDLGNVPIEKIAVGDHVLTEDGTFKTVTATICKGKKATIRIRTSFGKELLCTEDHKVLTQYGWIEAGRLNPYVHLIKAFWTQPFNGEYGNMRDWCIGLYLANGSSHTPTEIACRNRNDAETIKRIFDNEFELSSVVHFHGRCWYVRLVTTSSMNGYFSKSYKPNKFHLCLKELGIKGLNVYSKRMPTNPSLMMIAGFIDGDGCVNNKRVRLRNKMLALDLFNALQSHRIPSSYYMTIEEDKEVYNVSFNDALDTKIPYVIKSSNKTNINHASGILVPSAYLATIDLTNLRKSVKANIKKGIVARHKAYKQTVEKYGGKCEHPLWAEVLSINEDEIRDTWDLSVAENHSFCVGGVIVHNCYQEQFMSVAHTLGGFDLGKTDYLRKAIGKKKADLMASLKSDFIAGAIKNGCPPYEAEEIWGKIETAGKYSFNRSHAAAYALTAFCGAWLKANYPSAFYTVALQWADDKEIPALMSEMERCSEAKIVPPDINHSTVEFFTDYNTDEIYWSLNRIKFVGVKTAEYIVTERTRGKFTGIEDFVERIFRRKLRRKDFKHWDEIDPEIESGKLPVNTRHLKNMILAGCFDRIENIKAVTERYAILKRAANVLGITLKDSDAPEELRDKHYFWSQQQITVSGIGSIDYRRIFDNSEDRPKVKGKAAYLSLADVMRDENDGRRAAICATVLECSEHNYKDRETGELKRFVKLLLSQNNQTVECSLWDEFYRTHKTEIPLLKGKIVILTATIRYSDYTAGNALQSYKNSLLFIQ